MLANVNSRIDGVIKDLTERKSSLQFLQKDIDDRKELLYRYIHILLVIFS